MKTVTNINQPRDVETSSAARSKLRKAADELVGQVFYGTLMRQMRASNLKGKYGHGGRGEEVFQAQLDDVLVTRAGGAQSSKLGDAIMKRYAHRAEVVEAYRDAQKTAQAELVASVKLGPGQSPGQSLGREVTAW